MDRLSTRLHFRISLRRHGLACFGAEEEPHGTKRKVEQIPSSSDENQEDDVAVSEAAEEYQSEHEPEPTSHPEESTSALIMQFPTHVMSTLQDHFDDTKITTNSLSERLT